MAYYTYDKTRDIYYNSSKSDDIKSYQIKQKQNKLK